MTSALVPSSVSPALAHRHVGVHAHRAFLHVAVRDAERQPDSAQLLREAAGLFGRADVGLGDELHERGAGAVEVDERVGRARETTLRAAHVDHLAGVLFEVDARDADARGVRVLGVLEDVERAVSVRSMRCDDSVAIDLDIEVTVLAERQVVLGDLVVLGHVGIEVVLAMELAPARDVAFDSKPAEHRGLDGVLVGHRQCSGQAEAHRADARVGLAAELDWAAAEHLGVG